MDTMQGRFEYFRVSDKIQFVIHTVEVLIEGQETRIEKTLSMQHVHYGSVDIQYHEAIVMQDILLKKVIPKL